MRLIKGWIAGLIDVADHEPYVLVFASWLLAFFIWLVSSFLEIELSNPFKTTILILLGWWMPLILLDTFLLLIGIDLHKLFKRPLRKLQQWANEEVQKELG